MRCRTIACAVSALSCAGVTLLAVSSALAESGHDPSQQQKVLHTIPEDGQGNETMAPNELVRALMAARPHEDLVICLGGCAVGRDRVVYAQPARPAPPPVAKAPAEPQGSMQPTAVPSSDAPASPDDPAAASEPAHAQPAPSGARTSEVPDTSNGAPLPALPDAAPADGGMGSSASEAPLSSQDAPAIE